MPFSWLIWPVPIIFTIFSWCQSIVGLCVKVRPAFHASLFIQQFSTVFNYWAIRKHFAYLGALYLLLPLSLLTFWLTLTCCSYCPMMDVRQWCRALHVHLRNHSLLARLGTGKAIQGARLPAFIHFHVLNLVQAIIAFLIRYTYAGKWSPLDVLYITLSCHHNASKKFIMNGSFCSLCNVIFKWSNSKVVAMSITTQ